MMINTIMKTSTTSNCKSNLPEHIYIFSVEDHDYWKSKLLKSIEQMKEINNIQLNQSGFYYDFNIANAKRTYKQLMDNILLPYVNEVEETYGFKAASESKRMNQNFWFQQYFQGSEHTWHNHNGHFALIYYIELPDPAEATEFLNYSKLDLKEGDIIFFPSFLSHRSPKIKSNLRKTIISGNISFEVDREFIKHHGEKRFRNR